MICYVCAGQDWFSMEKIHSESEIIVCRGCGNVAHRVNPAEETKLKDFYRTEYRPAPNHGNLLTTTHKRMYIATFLREFLDETDKNKKKLLCGDVGCATGYIPAWLRSMGHKATGCELTITYRRFAEKFYGIPVTEELEPKHKYDLITIYHVLEHLMEPDKKLAQYVGMLAEGGHILISTPQWFDTLEEASGSSVGSFDHLFHKNHINIFSATSLKNLFRKSGLEIVKEDHVQYGQTYLLKKGAVQEIVKEDWQEQVAKLQKASVAIGLFQKRKFQEAIDVWPRFPEAWAAMAHVENMKDPEKQKDTFDEAFKVLPENSRLKLAFGMWLYMREDIPNAQKVYQDIMAVKPNEIVLMFMGYCLGKLRRTNDAIKAFSDAAEICPLKWQECMDHICALSVMEPCWEERAVEQMKKTLLGKAMASGAKPTLRDPAMDQEAVK